MPDLAPISQAQVDTDLRQLRGFTRAGLAAHDHNLVLSDRNHAWTDSVNDVITLFLKQDFFNSRIVFVFVGNYHLRSSKWQAIPVVSYVFPGIHWRFDMGYSMHGGAQRRWVNDSDQRDRVVLRLRYEF